MLLTTTGRKRRRCENMWAALYCSIPLYFMLCGIVANIALAILVYDRIVH